MNEEYRPSGFTLLPIVIKNLLIINGIMFLADMVSARFGIDLSEYLGLHFFMSSFFKPWQPLTYMFMHANFSHLFFNMFALWMFGSTLENFWGPKRFLIFYLVCGLGAALIQEGVQFVQMLFYDKAVIDYVAANGAEVLRQGMNYADATLARANSFFNGATVGASGAVYGLLLAFGMMFPNSRIYLYFLVPIKAKWFVIAYAVIELINGLGASGLGASGDHVAHFAHLGGMLFGLILILIWKKKGKLY